MAQKYRTLEQDLIACFAKRKIKVDSIKVDQGATVYVISVTHPPRTGKL